MEEASVAGESPDRSKQHESSAEPTSGSASPVPEARSETSTPRDPRLAVTRESASKSRGGVDTATRTLSVQELAEAAEGAERAAEAAQEPSGDTGDATDAGATRDAERVAPGAEGEGDTETADADSRAGSEDDAETADADSRAGSEGEDDGDATDVSEAASADADASEDPAERDEPAAGPGDTRLREAVAAWVASADDKPTADTQDADGADGTGEDEGEGAADAVQPARGDSEAETDSGSDGGAEETDGTDDAADVTDAADADANTATDTDADADSDSDADEPSADQAGATHEPDQADDDATADDSHGSGTPDASETPGISDDRAEAVAADTDGDSKTDGTDDVTDAAAAAAAANTATDADADADIDADGPGKAPAADNPFVDQPTAVFKAPRLSAPAVDQPTTMLKFDGAAKAKAKNSEPPSDTDTAGKATEPDKPSEPTNPTPPEAEVERTSKFVALKPLDDPATRKPKAADATTSLRRVTKPAPAATPDAAPNATSSVPQVGPERTTQQPLPPKPPLDLLAELTNTPPPPDTPVRTAFRRVKIWTPLVLLLVVVFAVVQAVRPLPTPELQLTAKDSYTFEGAKPDLPWPADGQAALDVQGIGSFGSSGEQKPVPIASVAKVMTAYVILRDHPLKSGAAGPKIKIDQAAQDQSDAGQESTVDVTKGDSISQREALESILIASANNVARLLARWDAGSEKAFVAKMNAAAKGLGMTNTTYTDPSGLNNTTVSTAVDQVKLAKKAMEEPAFREVAAMMSYVDYKGTKHDNWNRLVGYNNVVGIKTGTTTSALGNLVFAAKKEVDGEVRRIVGAVVRQPAGGSDNTILAAALDAGDKLVRAAQQELKSATILKKGDVVGYADDGLGGRTPVVATKDVTAVGWAGLTVKLTFAPDDLPHTAKAGTKVGTLTVGDGSGSAVKVPVALQKDLVEPGLMDKLTRLG